MSKKKDKLILGIVISAAVCYIGNKLISKWSSNSNLIKDAKRLISEGSFKDAINLLNNITSPDYNTYCLLFECHYKLGNLVNALTYVNKCISYKPNNELLEIRYSIHNKLGMSKEAFKDLFLINLLSGEEQSKKERAAEYLKKICIKLAKNHRIDIGTEGNNLQKSSTFLTSKINYGDFFDTLFFLKDTQDPAVVFLNSREYGKCYDLVKESDNEFHKFIYGCFNLVNGDHHYATKIFEENNYSFSKILLSFIKSKKMKAEELNEIKEKLESENDPTTLFYFSKIFENIDDKETQFKFLNRCLSVYSNSCAVCSLIVLYIKQEKFNLAEELIKKSLKEFTDSVVLACISLEYYIDKGDLQEAVKILEMIEKVAPEDPRVYLFKYNVNSLLNREDISILEKGLELDPNYWKLYIYLGSKSSSIEKSLNAYKNALRCARGFDEVYTTYRMLVAVETQVELFEEFPNLFTKEKATRD